MGSLFSLSKDFLSFRSVRGSLCASTRSGGAVKVAGGVKVRGEALRAAAFCCAAAGATSGGRSRRPPTPTALGLQDAACAVLLPIFSPNLSRDDPDRLVRYIWKCSAPPPGDLLKPNTIRDAIESGTEREQGRERDTELPNPPPAKPHPPSDRAQPTARDSSRGAELRSHRREIGWEVAEAKQKEQKQARGRGSR